MSSFVLTWVEGGGLGGVGVSADSRVDKAICLVEGFIAYVPCVLGRRNFACEQQCKQQADLGEWLDAISSLVQAGLAFELS